MEKNRIRSLLVIILASYSLCKPGNSASASHGKNGEDRFENERNQKDGQGRRNHWEQRNRRRRRKNRWNGNLDRPNIGDNFYGGALEPPEPTIGYPDGYGSEEQQVQSAGGPELGNYTLNSSGVRYGPQNNNTGQGHENYLRQENRRSSVLNRLGNIGGIFHIGTPEQPRLQPHITFGNSVAGAPGRGNSSDNVYEGQWPFVHQVRLPHVLEPRALEPRALGSHAWDSSGVQYVVNQGRANGNVRKRRKNNRKKRGGIWGNHLNNNGETGASALILFSQGPIYAQTGVFSGGNSLSGSGRVIMSSISAPIPILLSYNNTAEVPGDRNTMGKGLSNRDKKRAYRSREINKNRQKLKEKTGNKGGKKPGLANGESDECENKDRQGNMYEILREDMDDLNNNIGGVEKENAENNSYTDRHGDRQGNVDTSGDSHSNVNNNIDNSVSRIYGENADDNGGDEEDDGYGDESDNESDSESGNYEDDDEEFD